MPTLEERLKALRGGGGDLEQRLAALREQPSANAVFRETASRKALNNIAAVPGASGGLMADAVAALRAGTKHAASAGVQNARRLFGQTPEPGPTFGQRFQSEVDRDGLLSRAARNIPRPTVNEISAAVKSAPSLFPGGETPGDAYDRNLTDIEAEEFAMRDAHPTAAAAGDIAGDVGSLFLARRGTGLDKAVRKIETKLGTRTGAKAAESMAQDIEQAFTSKSFKSLARGAGRSVESGAEAAALQILNDPEADPVEAAAIAAGAQMIGSGASSVTSGILSGSPGMIGLKITGTAMTTWGFLQVLKSATPGGQDRILESMESGYDKVALALGLGAASAGLGLTRYGRGNVNLSDQTRAILDGVSTAHRGTTLSLVNSWAEADESERATIERVVEAVAKDPHYRGKNAAERRVVSQIRNRYRTGGSF